MLIRPESIHFSPVDDAMELQGVVKELESAGGEVRGRIYSDGTGILFRRYSGEVDVKEGDRVKVWIPFSSIKAIGGCHETQ